MTLDDLSLLLEELMRVREQWYRLGLQLKVRPETLETIREQFSGGMSKVATDCLRVFIECQRNYYIHANSWIVQGWHSSQAQDPLAK